MKNYLLGVLTIVLCLTLVGCGKAEEEKETNKKYDYLVLVNKYSQLPDDWEKNVELEDAKDFEGGTIQVEKEALAQFYKLQSALHEDGVDIVLDSAYRSVAKQQKLWDDWSADPEKGIDYVRKFVAVPGYSEHHTGLAIDIAIKKDGKIIYDNDEMIAEREIFAKIHAKLADYGFILRYLEGRDNVTGYAYEPWHLRYVGSSEVAKEIMDKDITFEEYLDTRENLKEVREAVKYKIERTLQEYFNDAYKDKISNSRFNVTKIYTEEEAKEEPIKSLKLGKNEFAFEVTYQLQPAEGIEPNTLISSDGEYDENLGWVKNISRIGVLRYNDENGNYSIDNFGTGW
jgi:D-alanyl-D-alanine carboxypeptidase